MVTPLETLLNSFINAAQTITPQGLDPFTFWTSFFLILSTTYYATLQVKFFSKQTNELRVIGIIMSLLLAYFGATNPQLSVVISRAFPQIGLLIIGFVSFVLAAVVATSTISERDELVQKWLVNKIVPTLFIGSVLLVLWQALTGVQAPVIQRTGSSVILMGVLEVSDVDVAIILIVGLFILLLWWIFNPQKIREGG